MRNTATLVMGAVLLTVIAARAWASPSDHGLFEQGKAPRTFHIYPCTVVAAREAGPEEDSSIDVTFARPGGRPGSARVRLVGNGAGGPVFMTVEDEQGARVAGPERIADVCALILPAFWADLNADGREDFVIFVMAPLGALSSGAGRRRPGEAKEPHAPAREEADRRPFVGADVAFALSSKDGYRITALRPTMEPGAGDFVDLGDGNCRFVHTTLVYVGGERSGDGGPRGYRVHNLLEFKGDRVAVSAADARFPKWVRYAWKPGHGEATIITDEQKRRLWAEVPERIFRPPPKRKEPELASAEE